MVTYKCNFCGKRDIPTQAGLKVHIRLSKAGCQEAMEREINRSLSPADEAVHIPQRRHTKDDDGVPAELGDVSYYNDTPPPFVPSPRHNVSPEPETTENKHQSQRARVEEVEDEETYQRYARDFPTPADELGDAKTVFEEIFDNQKEKNESPWAPFADKDEWELARWLAKNVNQRATEEFLKMSGVSFIYFFFSGKKLTVI
jgi:hypothetical protein